MSAAAYMEAVFPDPPQVLGIQIRPLSAGHKLLLEHLDCVDGTIEGLALSVCICSQTYSAGIRFISSPQFGRNMARFARALSTEGRWPFRRVRVVDWAKEWATFIEHLKSGSKMPEIQWKEKNGEGGSAGAPEVNLVKCSLLSNHICTESEFLDRPWVLSIWDHWTLCEQRGLIRILSDEDVADLAELKRLANAAAAKEATPHE